MTWHGAGCLEPKVTCAGPKAGTQMACSLVETSGEVPGQAAASPGASILLAETSSKAGRLRYISR